MGRPPARSDRAPDPQPGDGPQLGGPQGDDALSRWRRRTRARLLAIAPLGAWRALLGIVLLLVAGLLRKYGVIQAAGFDLLLTIGLALLGFQIAANAPRRNGGNGNGAAK